MYLNSPSSSPALSSHSLVQRNYSALCFHLRERNREDRKEERFSKAHWLSWLSGHMEITKCVHGVCFLCACVCAYMGHVAVRMCMCVFVSEPPPNTQKTFSPAKGSEWEMRGANETSQEYEPRRDTETL